MSMLLIWTVRSSSICLLSDNFYNEHEEDLCFCYWLQRELFEEEEDDARGSKSEREDRSVGEGFEEERTEMVLK
jgi:hypothetical protein